MKIKHIQINKSPSWGLLSAFRTLNIKHGKNLGSGAFGVVFESKTHKNRVIKVHSISRDTGYAAYIYAIANKKKKNKFLPVVYSLTFYEFKNGMQILVAELERLYELQYEDAIDAVEFLEPMYCESTRKKHWALVDEDVKDYTKFMREIYRKYRKIFSLGGDMHCGNVMIRKNGSFVVTDPFTGCGGQYLEKHEVRFDI